MHEKKELSYSYTRVENSILSMQEIYNTPEYMNVFVEIESPNPILYANLHEASKLPLGFLHSDEYYNHVIASENGLTFVNTDINSLHQKDILAINEYANAVSDLTINTEKESNQQKVTSKFHINYFNTGKLISFPHGLIGLRNNDKINNKQQEILFNNLLIEQSRINKEIEERLRENTVDMCNIRLREKENIKLVSLPNKLVGIYKRLPGMYLVISDLGLSECYIQSKKPSPPDREQQIIEKYLYINYTNHWRSLLFNNEYFNNKRGKVLTDEIKIFHYPNGLKEILKKESIKDY